MYGKPNDTQLEHTIGNGAYDSADTYPRSYPTTHRTFAFIDVCNYTTYTQQHGIHAAARMIHEFRNVVRIVVGRHRVRVAKWLGDGVLLVGIKPMPVLEALAELHQLFKDRELPLHSGVAMGSVIIFEGDDYIGSCVNIASRLADYARPAEILSYNVPKKHVPAHLQAMDIKDTLTVRGIGKLHKITVLHIQS
jgi:adenylate cyclase